MKGVNIDKGSKWIDKRVLVTGGASFIGSHLVDRLVQMGTKVTVVDNLSSGKIENLEQSLNQVKFIQKDLEYITKDEITQIFRDQNIVFQDNALPFVAERFLRFNGFRAV